MAKTDDKIEVQNFTSPGHVYRVDRTRYEAVKAALLQALPAGAPAMTLADIKARLLPLLPEDLFPGGAKAGWWFKAVQLDLEVKAVLVREPTRPLRIRRA